MLRTKEKLFVASFKFESSERWALPVVRNGKDKSGILLFLQVVSV